MNEGSPLRRFFFSELVSQAGGVGFNHHVTPRDRCLWISSQDRSRKFQKGRVLDFNCCWCNNVAKANIDLHWDSSASKGCMEANPHALVLGILVNPGDLYRLCIEFNPVRFGFEFANFSDQSANVLKLVAHL